MKLTLDNFFSHLIFHPNDADTEKDRFIAKVASIGCAIFSIGICHAICAIRNCFTNRPSDQASEQDKKISVLKDLALTTHSTKASIEKNTNGIDSINIENILKTTLQALKNGLSQHKINEFISIKVDLKINNNEDFHCIIGDSQGTVYKTEDLLFLEDTAKQMIQKISESIVEVDKNEKISIEWDFIITNINGNHTFSFIFEKTAHYCFTNGALFGIPSYSFHNTNSDLFRKESEKLQF